MSRRSVNHASDRLVVRFVHLVTKTFGLQKDFQTIGRCLTGWLSHLPGSVTGGLLLQAVRSQRLTSATGQEALEFGASGTCESIADFPCRQEALAVASDDRVLSALGG
jgi:hypothetical protein